MSIGGGASSGNSTTQLDPQIKGDWEDLLGQARATAAQPTPQQSTADFTPTGLAGQAMTVAAANSGGGALNSAVNTASNYAGGVGGMSVAADQVNAPTFGGADLQRYMNPYTQDVYDTSLGDLNLARQRAIVGNSSDATLGGGEGAWGGSRAGVADALTNEAFGRQASDLAANLNNQNYTQATGLQQQYGQMGQQAQTSNQNADLAAGEANQSTYNQELDRALQAGGLLGTLGQAQQSHDLTGASAVSGVGAQQQQLLQTAYDTDYNNAQAARNLPLQTEESAFGIIPNTGSGSVTNSKGKSAQAGIG